MREAITDTQWAAARAIIEGAPTTHARVAACMGVHTTTVSHRVSEYGWKSLDFRHPRVRAAHSAMVALAAAARAGEELDPADALDEAGEDAVRAASGGPEDLAGAAAATALEPLAELPPEERIVRIGAMLTRRTEAILVRIEAGQPVESRQVASLASLVQLSERIAVLARQEMVKQAYPSDKQVGDVLERLNKRIVYLAISYAREILFNRGGMSQAEIDAAIPAYDGS
jgi:hypothetical protein